MPESGGGSKVLLQGAEEPVGRVVAPRPDAAWGLIGWAGLVLALAGLADQVLLWIPLRFGSMEWEFATVVSSTSGIPLVAIGLTALLGAASVRQTRWLLWVLTVVLAFGALWLAAEFVLFLTNVPPALAATEGGARVGVMKAIFKTGILAILFGAASGFGAIWSFKLAKGKARKV